MDIFTENILKQHQALVAAGYSSMRAWLILSDVIKSAATMAIESTGD